MEKKVDIKIISIQTDITGEKEKVEFYTKGTYKELENGCEIVYDESTIREIPSAQATVKLENDTIKLTRSADMGAIMKFKCNTKNSAEYSTPYGIMEVHYETHEIKYNLEEEPKRIYFRYTLSFRDGGSSFLNELELEIK